MYFQCIITELFPFQQASQESSGSIEDSEIARIGHHPNLLNQFHTNNGFPGQCVQRKVVLGRIRMRKKWKSDSKPVYLFYIFPSFPYLICPTFFTALISGNISASTYGTHITIRTANLLLLLDEDRKTNSYAYTTDLRRYQVTNYKINQTDERTNIAQVKQQKSLLL